MGSSKSSQTTRNIIIACLALWSIISIIIIVVWATSPDMKGASQCRAELDAAKTELDREQKQWSKERQALNDLVNEGLVNQSQLQTRIDELRDQLRHLNLSLVSCRLENVFLMANITWLEQEIELHKAVEANLTAQISQQKELIEYQQLNLTQIDHELGSCTNSLKAAEHIKTAAVKQKEACETRKQYLDKQLTKCQKQPQTHVSDTESSNDGPPGPRSGFVLLMVFSIGLVLIPCKYPAEISGLYHLLIISHLHKTQPETI